MIDILQLLSPLLALLNRSLREDVRLLRFHVLRIAFVLIIVVQLLIAGSSWTVDSPGLQVFRTITYLNFWIISLAGAGFFATAITEEKEEGSLALLRMAGIGPLALLLGKSTSRLITASVLLSLQVPFTFLAITLGGVTPRQVIAAYAALLAYLFLVANLALVCSVSCRQSKHASAWAGACLALVLFLPLLGQAVLDGLVSQGVLTINGAVAERARQLLTWGKELSVWERISTLMKTGFHEPWFSPQVTSNLCVSGLCFAAAWLRLTIWEQRLETPAAGRGWLTSYRSPLRHFRPGRPWRHSRALTWKDLHFISGGKIVMLIKFAAYGAIAAAQLLFVSSLGYGWATLREAAGLTQVAMLWVLGIESVLLASRIFQDEIRDKTLPLLVLLPISLAPIAYAKTLGCMLGLLPALFWFSLGFVDFNNPGRFPSWHDYFSTLYALAAILVLIHFIALGSLYFRSWTLSAVPFLGLLSTLFAGCCCMGTPGVVLVLGLHAAILERLKILARE